MSRRLRSIDQKAQDSGGTFTPGGLRWLAFNRENNGSAAMGVWVKIGRRIYIDEDAFERWIDAQQERAA